ncbi:MAG: YciI family protein [Zoogloea sp.]|nr:YciI family protein [Zoogloea sp.]MCA0188002.1 YciI family protein [Pseudomonadota bacterium]
MLYALIGEDAPNTLEQRLAVRGEHLARLQALQAEGRLILAGPCPAVDSPDPGPAGFTGSVIVAEFDSLAAAQAWADADPYTTTGVFARCTVKPFRKVLP